MDREHPNLDKKVSQDFQTSLIFPKSSEMEQKAIHIYVANQSHFKLEYL